jgi:hypothetical protein
MGSNVDVLHEIHQHNEIADYQYTLPKIQINMIVVSTMTMH